jgi:K+-transporting ATPase KdpF subunit
VGLGKSSGTAIGGSMNTLYVIGGLIALALLIYLVVALLKPEAF